jgi:hypothetical protein
VFPYLSDTFRSSFDRVIHGPGNPPLSILVGAVFAGLLLFCARGCLAYARAMWTWILPTRLLRGAWTSGTLAAAVVLFALGFDWLRWISSIGFAALLAGGALVLLDGRSLDSRASADPPDREIWHRPVPSEVPVQIPGLLTLAVATYLLVLAPLPNFIKNVGDAAQTLLSVPRSSNQERPRAGSGARGTSERSEPSARQKRTNTPDQVPCAAASDEFTALLTVMWVTRRRSRVGVRAGVRG